MEEEELFYTRPELKELMLQRVFFGDQSTCTVGTMEDTTGYGTQTEPDIDDPTP